MNTGIIYVACKMRATNRNFSLPEMGTNTIRITQKGYGGGSPGMQIVGPHPELLDISQLVEPGWCRLQNLDEDQTILYGLFVDGTFHRFGMMKPNEPAEFRIDPLAVIHVMIDPASELDGSTSSENQAKLAACILES